MNIYNNIMKLFLTHNAQSIFQVTKPGFLKAKTFIKKTWLMALKPHNKLTCALENLKIKCNLQSGQYEYILAASLVRVLRHKSLVIL